MQWIKLYRKKFLKKKKLKLHYILYLKGEILIKFYWTKALSKKNINSGSEQGLEKTMAPIIDSKSTTRRFRIWHPVFTSLFLETSIQNVWTSGSQTCQLQNRMQCQNHPSYFRKLQIQIIIISLNSFATIRYPILCDQD